MPWVCIGESNIWVVASGGDIRDLNKVGVRVRVRALLERLCAQICALLSMLLGYCFEDRTETTDNTISARN